MMMGRGRDFSKPAVLQAITELQDRYEQLIIACDISPALKDAFTKRLLHAQAAGRDPEAFLEEERQVSVLIEKKAKEKERVSAIQKEAQRRNEMGESHADKTLNEYRHRISHYPTLDFHPHANSELCRMYGAVNFFDQQHWESLNIYFRRIFLKSRQHDMWTSMEQRFWDFIPRKEGRLPLELDHYYQLLENPISSQKEKNQELQKVIKTLAFFLHDLLDFSKRAQDQSPSKDEKVEEALVYISMMISNFRLKDLKKR